MIDIDFFADAQAYINNKDKSQQTTPPPPVVITPVKLEPEPPKVEETKPLDYFPEIQGFSVSDDCTTLTYNGKTYTIPDFYNKKMIKIRDRKTLEMVFISLDLAY